MRDEGGSEISEWTVVFLILGCLECWNAGRACMCMRKKEFYVDCCPIIYRYAHPAQVRLGSHHPPTEQIRSHVWLNQLIISNPSSQSKNECVLLRLWVVLFKLRSTVTNALLPKLQ